MKLPSSENSMMESIRRSTSRRVMPWIEAFRTAFSRPLKSWWKPAPSSSSEAILPPTSTVPPLGGMIPASSLRSVLLPAPLAPTTPSEVPGSTFRSTSRSAHSSRVRVRRRRSSVSFSVRLCSR
jgi:hypothetical protein